MGVERRHKPRRAEDRGAIHEVRQSNRTLRRVAIGAIIAWASVGTVAAASLAIQEHNDGLAASRATNALRQSVQAKQLTRALGQQRRETILGDCRAQNARNAATVHALDVLLGRAEKHAKTAQQREQITASRASTILLINALAPKQDCARLLARQAPG